MRKYIFSGVMLLCLIFAASVCYAAAGNATEYKVTVKSIQLLTEGGSWITIATPNQEIDIASAAAGAVAGSMASGSKIPAGRYVNFRMVISNIMKVAGTDSGTNTTKASGTITITGTTANGASTTTWADDGNPDGLPTATLVSSNTWQNGGTPGEITATLNLGSGGGFASSDIRAQAINNLTTPIEVKESSIISVYFQFDTQSTVYFDNTGGTNKMYFVPPSGGTAFGITVDGVSSTITAANMKMEFNK